MPAAIARMSLCLSLWMSLWLSLWGAPAAAAPLDGAGQLVVVRAASFSAREGTLQRYTRRDTDWVAEGPTARVSLGGKGLAWGRGVAPATPSAAPLRGPAKREGDARTPAGVFRLGAATGRAASPPAGARIPYTQATPSLECVDDRRSRHYNRILERTPDADWTSSEAMLAPPIYDLTVFIEHNPEQVPGSGSCIFLHVWRRPGGTTLGCTAMEAAELEALIAWLDPAASPLLVVLPDGAYRSLREAWDLP
jgi:zinc D-Ala-D-Ala dipeptidase